MNILAVTPYLPYPPNSGGKAAQFSMLKAYPSHYNIILIYQAKTKEDSENALQLERLLPNVRVVLCDPIELSSDEPEEDEKKSIALRVLHFPAKVVWKLLFIYESLIDKVNHRQKVVKTIQLPPSEFRQLLVPAYHQISDSILKAIQRHLDWADIIQADFVDLLHLSCLNLGSKPKVFVMHQVHTSYVETFFQSTSEQDEELLISEYHCQLTHLLEISFLAKYDAIIVFSMEDQVKLKAMGVVRPIYVSPFTFPLDLDPVDPASLAQEEWKRELVFIGSGEHGPNEKGLRWFLDHIYEQLEDHNDGHWKPPLKIIGSWSAQQQQELHGETICFTGFVDNLSEAIKGRVCICPVQIGAGLRTKLLAAAMSSSPIVTTSLGCQGIGMKHEMHCLIADSSTEYASQVLRLLDQIDSLGPKLANNAFSLVKDNFSLDTVAKQQTNIIDSLLRGKVIN